MLITNKQTNQFPQGNLSKPLQDPHQPFITAINPTDPLIPEQLQPTQPTTITTILTPPIQQHHSVTLFIVTQHHS